VPQFDKVTFFIQIFWLFFFFLGFYLIFLQTFLPKLASVLKLRVKKLQKGSEGASVFSEEQKTTTFMFNKLIEEIFVIVKYSLNLFKEKASIWTSLGVGELKTKNFILSNVEVEKIFYKNLIKMSFYDRSYDSLIGSRSDRVDLLGLEPSFYDPQGLFR
jgi:hypothetical protein